MMVLKYLTIVGLLAQFICAEVYCADNNLSELDLQRQRLRQELLKDRADAAQRKAYENRLATETLEEREARQRNYERGASNRGEEIIALQDGNYEYNSRAQSLSNSWAREQNAATPQSNANNSSNQSMSEAERARRARNALSNWATGNTDVREVRRQIRQEDK